MFYVMIDNIIWNVILSEQYERRKHIQIRHNFTIGFVNEMKVVSSSWNWYSLCISSQSEWLILFDIIWFDESLWCFDKSHWLFDGAHWLVYEFALCDLMGYLS